MWRKQFVGDGGGVLQVQTAFALCLYNLTKASPVISWSKACFQTQCTVYIKYYTNPVQTKKRTSCLSSFGVHCVSELKRGHHMNQWNYKRTYKQTVLRPPHQTFRRIWDHVGCSLLLLIILAWYCLDCTDELTP